MSVPPSPSKGSTPGPFSPVSSGDRRSRSVGTSLTFRLASIGASRVSALFLDAAVRLPDHNRGSLVLASDLCRVFHRCRLGLALRDRLAALLLHLPAGLRRSLLDGVDLPLRHEGSFHWVSESCPPSTNPKQRSGVSAAASRGRNGRRGSPPDGSPHRGCRTGDGWQAQPVRRPTPLAAQVAPTGTWLRTTDVC